MLAREAGIIDDADFGLRGVCAHLPVGYNLIVGRVDCQAVVVDGVLYNTVRTAEPRLLAIAALDQPRITLETISRSVAVRSGSGDTVAPPNDSDRVAANGSITWQKEVVSDGRWTHT